MNNEIWVNKIERKKIKTQSTRREEWKLKKEMKLNQTNNHYRY